MCSSGHFTRQSNVIMHILAFASDPFDLMILGYGSCFVLFWVSFAFLFSYPLSSGFNSIPSPSSSRSACAFYSEISLGIHARLELRYRFRCVGFLWFKYNELVLFNSGTMLIVRHRIHKYHPEQSKVSCSLASNFLVFRKTWFDFSLVVINLGFQFMLSRFFLFFSWALGHCILMFCIFWSESFVLEIFQFWLAHIVYVCK